MRRRNQSARSSKCFIFSNMVAPGAARTPSPPTTTRPCWPSACASTASMANTTGTLGVEEPALAARALERDQRLVAPGDALLPPLRRQPPVQLLRHPRNELGRERALHAALLAHARVGGAELPGVRLEPAAGVQV